MSRKAFLIWGLAIIQTPVTLVAILAYLSISKLITPEALNAIVQVMYPVLFALILIGFGTLLYLRFGTIGRRKRILALCLPFYFLSLFVAAFLTIPLLDIIDFTGRGLMPIVDAIVDGQSITTWMKMRFVLLLAPGFYLANWGLFALLWFGNLDPRTPSKNRIVQFFKTGFKVKDRPKAVKLTKLTGA